jgi:alpha-aminoadipate carrier protein LysW
MSINCLECNQEINVPSDAIDGEIVTCNDCGSSFELVISQSEENSNGSQQSTTTTTISLKTAESVGEDWGE